MEVFAGLSVCVLVLVALFIAIKTFGLWLRTRGLPELLLAGMLMSATVLGYPLAIAGNTLSPSEIGAIQVVSQLMMSVGYGCLLLFTLQVFRPGALWARGLVGLLLLVLVAMPLVYLARMLGGNPLGAGEMTKTTLLTSVPIAIVYLWTTVEALGYHGKLRRQMRLGLADGVLANRVLLWGLMCLSAGVAVIVSNTAMLIQGALLSPGIVLVCSLLGLAHAGCLFLAFHPPAWYTLWVERRSVAAAG